MPLASMFKSQKKETFASLVNLTGPDKKRLIADNDRDLIDNEQKNIDALASGIYYSGQAEGFVPS